jgi:small ligand-binding sensory domain FIST
MPNRACARLFLGEFNEESVTQVAREARAELGAEVTCAVVFFSPDYTANLADFLELVRVYGQASLLLGCSAGGLVGPGAEAENQAGFSLLLLSLPRTRVQVCEFSQAQVEAGSGPAFWHLESGVGTEEVDGWIVLTNPVRFDAERWLAEWNQAYPGVPAIGGMASGEAEQIVLCRDGRIIDGDCLALSLSGGLSLRAIVSQGCRPIGEPLTITGAKEKWLLTLGSKPAYTVLNNVFNSLSQPEKDRARHNLFAGLALSEYVEDFKRGDFLIRNILSADPQAGAVAIASAPRVGQTLQYQLRDRDSADEDLRELCYAAEEDGVRPFASLLFACNGRGRGLFAGPDHDAGVLAEIFGAHPGAGFFCNGEIGPIGRTNYLHGYTASCVLFCEP